MVMARFSVRLLSMLMLCVLTACSLWNREEETVSSNVTVQSAGGIIPVLVCLVKEDPPANESQATPFKTLMQDGNVHIPYVNLGESIQIRLDQDVSATYELTDVLLKEDGSYKYNIPNDKPEVIEISSGTGSFVLKGNMAAFLSSNSKDYEPGAAIRGFKLTEQGDGEKQGFYFVLRTDAGSASGMANRELILYNLQ